MTTTGKTVQFLTWKFPFEALLSISAVALASLFILLSFVIPFSLPLYLVLIGGAALISLRSPLAGLVTIIFCTIVFERFFTLAPLEIGDQIIKLYPLDVMLLASLLGVIGQWLTGQQRPIIRDGLFGAGIWLLPLAAVAWFLWSISQPAADLELAFSALKHLALYAAVFFLAINAIRTPHHLRQAIGATVVACMIVVGFALYGFATGQGLWTEFVPLSTPGSRIIGGPHSLYLALFFTFGIHWLVSQSRWRLWHWLLVIILLAAGIALLGSLQRHLWLAVIAAIGFLLTQYQPNQRQVVWRLVGGGVLLAALAVTASFWLSSWQIGNFLLDSDLLYSLRFRFISFIHSAGDSSAVWRVAAWHRAWELWQANWLAGIGFGQLMTFSIGENDFAVPVREVHNSFIAIIVQMGLAGLISLLALLVSGLRAYRQGLRQLRGRWQQALIGFAGLVLLFLVAANFGTYFSINLLVIFFWLCLAGMSLSYRFGK